MKSERNVFIKRLTVTAMMIAAQIVLSRQLVIALPTMKIGFSFLPMVIVGMLYGPVYSSLAWGLSDILGATLFPTGPFFPGFTISAVLNGLIFGLFLYRNHTKVARVALAVGTASTVVSIGIDTIWFTILRGNYYANLTARMLRSAIMAPIQFLTIVAIGKLLADFIYNNSATAYEKEKLRRYAFMYYNGEFLLQRDEISDKMLSKLTSCEEYISSEYIFCYVGRANEVDTSKIINRAIEDKKTIAVPLCDTNGVMSARRINDLNELKKGHFGILEPKEDSEIIEIERIDLAIVPCLLANKKGRRIGFGGGYYDRYLKNSKAFKIILCPGAMIKNRIPNAAFDLKADLVISEEADNK